MTEQINPSGKRQIWIRGLFMLLMIMVLQVTGTVILCITLFQFIVMLISGQPNNRLQQFSRSLSLYLGHLAGFLTFTTEDVPFPFSDWPAENT